MFSRTLGYGGGTATREGSQPRIKAIFSWKTSVFSGTFYLKHHRKYRGGTISGQEGRHKDNTDCSLEIRRGKTRKLSSRTRWKYACRSHYTFSDPFPSFSVTHFTPALIGFLGATCVEWAPLNISHCCRMYVETLTALNHVWRIPAMFHYSSACGLFGCEWVFFSGFRLVVFISAFRCGICQVNATPAHDMRTCLPWHSHSSLGANRLIYFIQIVAGMSQISRC